MNEITQILELVQRDESLTTSRLIPAMYDELKELASRKMNKESSGHTLSATALVHEAWLRIVEDNPDQKWDSRRHFYSAAAQAMRRILIESGRKKGRQKRGSGQKPI
ncbi:MAG: ECF-type sigma factor, partial [Verrucomicrobiota bacterium]